MHHREAHHATDPPTRYRTQDTDSEHMEHSAEQKHQIRILQTVVKRQGTVQCRAATSDSDHACAGGPVRITHGAHAMHTFDSRKAREQTFLVFLDEATCSRQYSKATTTNRFRLVAEPNCRVQGQEQCRG